MKHVEMQIFDRGGREVRMIFEGWFGVAVAKLFWWAATKCSPTYQGGTYSVVDRPYDDGTDEWCGYNISKAMRFNKNTWGDSSVWGGPVE